MLQHAPDHDTAADGAASSTASASPDFGPQPLPTWFRAVDPATMGRAPFGRLSDITADNRVVVL